MKARAFLVLGPESSGTRLFTRILIACGCSGSGAHKQPFDTELPKASGNIVWRRSFPHHQHWPDVSLMAHKLRKLEYEVVAVVTVRNFYQSELSQVKGHHPKTVTEAHSSMMQAYVMIFSGLTLAKVPFIVTTYEELILNPDKSIQVLADRLGLSVVQPIEDITNQNEKYYMED